MQKVQNYLITFFILMFYYSSLANSLGVTSLNTNSTQQILYTYGTNDLASKPFFKKGYISFCYWKNISYGSNKITSEEERISASNKLDKLIIAQLNTTKQDHVLEIGSGLGYGRQYLATHYSHSNLTGVDMTLEQISISKDIHNKIIAKHKINFEVASAYNIPKKSESCSKIYSVEAAQHFPSILQFANVAWRLLKPNGILITTDQFSTSKNGYNQIEELLSSVDQNIDHMVSIDQDGESLKLAIVEKVEFYSIKKMFL